MKLFASPILLLIIILAGLIARLYDLDGESLWVDEGQSIYISSLDLSRAIEENSKDNHPPLYNILLHFWMRIVPHTVFYLRFLSVLFGVVAIFLMYKVGEALINKKTGMISSLFLSLSVFHLHFSQEIRSYVLVVVLILLSYYLLIRWEKKSSSIYLVLLIIVDILLVYTHFLGWFIIFAQNIFYAIRFPLSSKRLINVLFVDAIILICYIPWLTTMVNRFSDLQNEFWVSTPTWLSIPQTFLVHARTYTFFGVTLLILFFFLSLISLFRVDKSKVKLQPTYAYQKYMLLLWMWIPILVPFIISFIFAPVYIFRITIGASLALFLLSALGFNYLTNRSVKISVFVVSIILFTGNGIIFYQETNKERWKEVTEYVEKNADPEDLLIFHAGFGLERAFNFYAKRDDLKKQPFPKSGLEVNENNISEVAQRLNEHDRVWLILSHSRDDIGLIVKKIGSEFKLLNHKKYISKNIYSHRPYIGIEVFQFQR